MEVEIVPDADGYIGRECPSPECEGYFKLRPATGLDDDDVPCRCAYCGHSADASEFCTKAQVEYAQSLALRAVTDALERDLKSTEFQHRSYGPFGFSMGLKVKAGRPVPIRHYREEALETEMACRDCSLEYSVFGVFAFCPDCGAHNSQQILFKNLDLIDRQLVLAAAQQDEEMRVHLVEDALENCVSAFDAFGREACRVRAARSTDPAASERVSFQNLPRAAQRINVLFGGELQSALPAAEWAAVHRSFQRRHLLAHAAGVVDQPYLEEAQDSQAKLGRRLSVDPEEVREAAASLRRLSDGLLALLPAP